MESHLKGKKEDKIQIQYPQTSKETKLAVTSQLQRQMKNPDMASCWLNACLQVLLTALDHSLTEVNFNSELGRELLKLQKQKFIDPSNIKEILVPLSGWLQCILSSRNQDTAKVCE